MKYRRLKDGEIIRRGDQFLTNGIDCWNDDDKSSMPSTGLTYNDRDFFPYRRPIKSTSRTSTNSRLRKCPHCKGSGKLPHAADVVGNLTAHEQQRAFRP